MTKQQIREAIDAVFEDMRAAEAQKSTDDQETADALNFVPSLPAQAHSASLIDEGNFLF